MPELSNYNSDLVEAGGVLHKIPAEVEAKGKDAIDAFARKIPGYKPPKTAKPEAAAPAAAPVASPAAAPPPAKPEG